MYQVNKPLNKALSYTFKVIQSCSYLCKPGIYITDCWSDDNESSDDVLASIYMELCWIASKQYQYYDWKLYLSRLAATGNYFFPMPRRPYSLKQK